MKTKTIKVHDVEVKYDLPERKRGGLSLWWEKNSVDVWLLVCLVPGLIVWGYVFYRVLSSLFAR